MSTERRMEGLSRIVESADNLHSLEGPPPMSDPPTKEEQRAYDEWWARTHTWTATVSKVEAE